MNTTQALHRKNLNKDQLQVLYLLYRFRFGTSELIAECQHISKRYMNIRLGILVDQQYIGRNFDRSYKLRNQHASYYLLTKGIKLLKEKPDFNPTVLRNIAKDRHASERFIAHSLDVFAIYCQLKQPYGDSLKFFTKSYLKLPSLGYFPNPLPDAYISLKDGTSRHYFLESFETALPFFVIQNRINYLLKYADEGEWPKQTSFPVILLVCEAEKLRQRVEQYAANALESSLVDDISIIAITKYNISVNP
jgi:hypothetical protein